MTITLNPVTISDPVFTYINTEMFTEIDGFSETKSHERSSVYIAIAYVCCGIYFTTFVQYCQCGVRFVRFIWIKVLAKKKVFIMKDLDCIKYKERKWLATSAQSVAKPSGAGAPEAPLRKGSCHANSMTEGLLQYNVSYSPKSDANS